MKMALSSMVSTAHANLSVGPPYDIGIYRNGSHTIDQYRLEIGSPYLAGAAGHLDRADGRRHRQAPADHREDVHPLIRGGLTAIRTAIRTDDQMVTP